MVNRQEFGRIPSWHILKHIMSATGGSGPCRILYNHANKLMRRAASSVHDVASVRWNGTPSNTQQYKPCYNTGAADCLDDELRRIANIHLDNCRECMNLGVGMPVPLVHAQTSTFLSPSLPRHLDVLLRRRPQWSLMFVACSVFAWVHLKACHLFCSSLFRSPCPNSVWNGELRKHVKHCRSVAAWGRILLVKLVVA